MIVSYRLECSQCGTQTGTMDRFQTLRHSHTATTEPATIRVVLVH